MEKCTVFETIDREGNAIGLYHETWDAAREAAVEMGLHIRRSQIVMGDANVHRMTSEPQEMTTETMLPDSAA